MTDTGDEAQVGRFEEYEATSSLPLLSGQLFISFYASEGPICGSNRSV